MSMSPDEFRDKPLGWRSSHPRWIRYRYKALLGLLTTCGSVLVAAVYFLARNVRDWTPVWENRGVIIGVAGFFAMFVIGGVLTSALLCRIAAIQLHGRNTQSRGAIKFDWWIVLLTILIAGAGPHYIGKLDSVPLLVKKLCAMLAFLPLLGLLFVLRREEDKQAKKGTDEGKENPRKWNVKSVLAQAFFWANLSVLTYLLAHDWALVRGLSETAQQLARFIPSSVLQVPPMLLPVILCVTSFLSLLLWRWLSSPAARLTDPKLPSRTAKKKPGKLTHSTNEECPVEMPIWGLEVCQQAELSADQRQRLSTDQVAQVDENSQWRRLFGNLGPTVDQTAVVDRCHNLFEKALTTLNAAAEDRSCPGFVVSGPDGSGRTTALIAAAVFAAFVRGQYVLYLAGDEQQASRIVEEIQSFLSRLALGPYVVASTISDAVIDGAVRKDRPVPQVLVGTPTALQRVYYGHSTNQLRLHRNLTRLPEVLLVDDLTSFSPEDRFHLPFQVDKHRLLVESTGRMLQVIAATDTLSDVGFDLMSSRLLGRTGLDKVRHHLRTRAREFAAVWHVAVPTDDRHDTLSRLVVACVHAKKKIVVIRPGIDEPQRAALRTFLLQQANVPKAPLRIVSSPEELRATRLSPHAIILDGEFSEEQSLAIRMECGRSDTIVFELADPLKPRGLPCPQLPVLTSQSAAQARNAHVGSVLRLMPQRFPIDGENLVRAGIGPAKLPEITTSIRPEFMVEIDRDITAHSPTATAALQATRSLPWRLVPERQAASFVRDSTSRTLLVTPTDVGKSARYARWFDKDALIAEAGVIDLAHCRQLLLTLPGRRLAPVSMRVNDDDAAARIDAEAWIGDGSDRAIPVMEITWSLPEDIDPRILFGGEDDGLLWLTLPDPIDAQYVVDGLCCPDGRSTRVEPIVFDCPVELSCLVLNQTSPHQLESNGLRAALAHTESHDDLPELAAAFGATADRFAPGVLGYTRLAATQINSDQGGVAVAVWFLEPTTSGRTASSLFTKLLRRDEERGLLLNALREQLDALHNSPLRPLTYVGHHTPTKSDRARMQTALAYLLRGNE